LFHTKFNIDLQVIIDAHYGSIDFFGVLVMKKNKTFTRFAASVLLCGAASIASAQELPVIGGLLGGDMLGGLGNLGGESLPLVESLPVLGTFLPFALGELPASLLAIEPPIDKTIAGLGQIGGLAGPVSGNPESLIRPVQKLAIPVAYDVIPVTKVLLNNPAGLPDFFTQGGVLIMPDIALIPAIPLVNQPL
tara:strand:- start:1876 stop:2451 length:576 start_codon:yes stop_codon:yes gene_type:complete